MLSKRQPLIKISVMWNVFGRWLALLLEVTWLNCLVWLKSEFLWSATCSRFPGNELNSPNHLNVSIALVRLSPRLMSKWQQFEKKKTVFVRYDMCLNNRKEKSYLNMTIARAERSPKSTSFDKMPTRCQSSGGRKRFVRKMVTDSALVPQTVYCEKLSWEMIHTVDRNRVPYGIHIMDPYYRSCNGKESALRPIQFALFFGFMTSRLASYTIGAFTSADATRTHLPLQ